jgi:hypothetical protein
MGGIGIVKLKGRETETAKPIIARTDLGSSTRQNCSRIHPNCVILH